ncbi:ArdC family protein [Tenacibaculum piscium]|uniref:ArdC family protein n=1 Tax=Tenacibaculum piscium TaxID=1458515 RepID=UPI001EEB8EBD|nr:zincin-like metallopeptidase domain-containing protein [Tenacibaculum piscium]
MTIQQQFKNLNGSTVSRSQLEVIIANAKKANDTEIVYRLSKILLDNKGDDRFYVSLRQYPTALAGSMHKGAYKEALTECGRLRKGWRFHKGGVLKIASVDKKTKQIKMALNGKKPCGCGGTKKTCGCKKKSLNANNLSFDELEGLGLPFIPNPESVEDPTALGKPFTNDDIYQMITDKMISLVEKSTGTGYKRKWGQKEFYEKDGFLIPINFVSKNAYRGVNPWLLKDDFLDVMDNPYFMTFKQIKEKKGTLKKGSKGKPIVYFTLLYKFDNPKTKKEFGTYDKEYMIKYIKNFGYSKSDFDDVVNSIPILKYYNVFNGSDIEEIDFKLDELKLGRVIKSDESLANERNEIAELIVANYPKMAPTIKHGGDEAYYNSAADGVQMPRFQSFETPNDYYRTLLHELIHSTGNEKRLARKFGKKFGSKDYAFEELVAEFGSVFLSANAGIIWHSNKNHEEYLANWNNSLKIAKDDNKFLMRAASAAQKASDFVLNLDASKVPAFYKELGKITDTKKTVKKTSTKKMVSIPDSSAYPVAIPETKITIKANAPFDSCGRLRKGWKFQNGKPVQVIPKKKATKKAEIKKVVVKKIEKPTKTVKRPSKEVVLKDRINQEGNYIKQITAFLKETRAKSKKTAKDKKNINYWVIAIKEAKKRKSLNEKLLKELGEILTPKKNDVTIYAYNKITAKEMAVYSDDELYLLYRAIAKQQNKTGIDKELIRYNRGVIIKALRHPLKHYSYLDKTYNFVLDELIEEKKLHDHAILGHDAHMYSDKVIAKGYAYANLARFIYFYRLSFPFYKRTKLLKEAQNPELRKLFEKEIKKRKLKVNVQAVVPITPEQKAIKRKRDKAKTVVKPTPIKLGNPKNTKNPENPKKTNTLAYKMANRQNKVSEIYKIRDKNISEFLGEIEVKQKESVVITLTGGQGSMKTRCAFRFMNAFAQKYKVGHASIEEHPESTLYYNKVDEYINDNALNNIHNPEINSISDLDMLVKENDIIVIDSFAKMQEIQKGFEVDKDLRKKYDGKLFIVIFQQTTDGKMRGGSKSQFDADIILFTEKFDNYQDNYIYADKNRYQNKNLTDLKYNIFEGVLKDLE